jgi:hypothetical protein
MPMQANASPLLTVLRSRAARRWLLACAIAILCSLAPKLARAKLPSPANCTIPSHIPLVGLDSRGQADPAGSISFVIRNLANIPEPSSMVVLDFSQTPDMEPSMAQPDPGVYSVSCYGGGRWVQALTDEHGAVTIRVVGCAMRSAADGAQGATVRILADGVLLGWATVSAFDQDGYGGVGPADLTDFLQDFFSPQYWARSDYDGNGTLGPNDLSVWLVEFFSGNSVHSGAMAGCP